MTVDADAVRQAVVDSVLALAPEADLARIDPGRSLREQLDIDSFDFLNLLIALNERLGVEVPEADYARVDSLDGLLGYLREALERRLAPAQAPPPPHA